MKLFVISGEPSGDLHASMIVKEIKRLSPKSQFTGWGGDHLRNQGVHVITDIKSLSIMGFSDVILKLPKLFRQFNLCKKQITDFNPDLLLLVDFSGFNLRIAKWAKKRGITVHYYIAPKTWAWHSGRNKILASCIDMLYCIFHFEQKYFRQKGINAYYVGNPSGKITLRHNPKSGNTIAILPGSRPQEIYKTLIKVQPLFEKRADLNWIISKMPHMAEELYLKAFINGLPQNVTLDASHSHELIQKATAAIITSGTATLEAAVIGCPQMVVYHTSKLNYFLGKIFISTKYISLPNILLGQKVVEEIIQDDLSEDLLLQSLERLLNVDTILEINKKYDKIRSQISGSTPEVKVANKILESLK